jgi:hypothetical protein
VPDIPDENRHEVVWSDLITGSAAVSPSGHAQRASAAAQGLTQPFADRARPALAEHIKDELADRAQRQLVEASRRTAGPEALGLPGTGTGPLANLDLVGPQALFNIPGLECVDDFTSYLLDDDVRNQVIGRFTDVVRPLLDAGDRIEVISHSWGTVVAYEALRRLDDAAGNWSGRPVHNLFTVGSALAIWPVKRSLIPEASDGRRPLLVQTWVNLNARFDIVGGHLRGNPFEVDYEYLDLPPVGCSTVIPNPVCAHGSYFNPQNVTVNQSIFAQYIEGGAAPSLVRAAAAPAPEAEPTVPATPRTPPAREVRFFLRAAPERADLQAAKAEWSARVLKPEPPTEHSVRAFMASVSPVPEHNVVGVGIDEKYTDDAPTGIRCLKFLVKTKFPESQMSANDLLPREYNGLPTDVEEVGLLVPYAKAKTARPKAKSKAPAAAADGVGMPDPKQKFRPAQPGCSVGFRFPNDQFVMAGTFGLLVQDGQGRYILSNNHVLANENALPVGSAIFQPGLLDQGNPDTDQVAELARFVTLSAQTMNKVDAAVARLLGPNLAIPDILFIGPPKGVVAAAEDMVVHKFGRTTSYRVGRVSSIDFDVKIPYDIGMVKFASQIAIRGVNGQRFSDQGDSGSAILDRDTGNVVGLLFGGRTDGTLTFANHIEDVFQALGVTLV